MKHCSACGGEIQENMRFCPHCGAGVENPDAQSLKDYWAEKLARQPEHEILSEDEDDDWTAEVDDEDLLDLDEEEKEIKHLMDGVRPARKKKSPWVLILCLLPAAAAILLGLWINREKKVTVVPGSGLYFGCTAEGAEKTYRNTGDWVELHPNGTMDLKLTGTRMEGHWKLEGETFLGYMDHRELKGTLKDGILTFPYGKVEFLFALPENRDRLLKKQDADEETVVTESPKHPGEAWAGEYYGTMVFTGGTGNWEGNIGEIYDVCGRILLQEDGTGRLYLWNRENQPGDRFLLAVVEFLPGTTDMGKMTIQWGRLHDMELGPGDFAVDPGKSPYSYYKNLFYIRGNYMSMTDPGDTYAYEILLRPWGESWEDVEASEDDYYLLPPSYYDWYIPLQNAGKKMPDSF